MTLRYIGDFISTNIFLFLMVWVIVGLTLAALFISWAERVRRRETR